jgi:hypothetical protein
LAGRRLLDAAARSAAIASETDDELAEARARVQTATLDEIVEWATQFAPEAAPNEADHIGGAMPDGTRTAARGR